MKRPKFFEDLDRSLSGEPEPEPVATIAAPVLDDAAVYANRVINAFMSLQLAQAMQCRQREEDAASLLRQIQNTTATGAMILAQQQGRGYGYGPVFGRLFEDAFGQTFPFNRR